MLYSSFNLFCSDELFCVNCNILLSVFQSSSCDMLNFHDSDVNFLELEGISGCGKLWKSPILTFFQNGRELKSNCPDRLVLLHGLYYLSGRN